MKNLLSTLRHQTFVFTTVNPLSSPPPLTELECVLLDPNTLEIRVDNQISLNQVFDILSKQGIIIHSLRNKTNRLEELFLDLINHEH